MRILLLEDDFTLSNIIEEFLVEIGYEVDCAYTGQKAIEIGINGTFDLYLFDVKVPFKNGIDVLKILRETKETPAIFLTSLNSVEDLQLGYEAGCDDYIKKPFELKELQLRIETLLKRNFRTSFHQKIHISPDIIFDVSGSKLVGSNFTFVLTKKEVKILKKLLENQGKIVSAQELINFVWEFDEDASEESLRTHIKNLRKYLGKDIIVNIRGQGYQLVLS